MVNKQQTKTKNKIEIENYKKCIKQITEEKNMAIAGLRLLSKSTKEILEESNKNNLDAIKKDYENKSSKEQELKDEINICKEIVKESLVPKRVLAQHEIVELEAELKGYQQAKAEFLKELNNSYDGTELCPTCQAWFDIWVEELKKVMEEK